MPLYRKSHMLAPPPNRPFGQPTDTSLCGRPMLIDEVWWQESGWEETLGVDSYFIEETRTQKGKSCGECNSRYSKLQDLRKNLRPSPYDQDLRAKAKLIGDQERRGHEAMAKWFTHMWGAEVELIL